MSSLQRMTTIRHIFDSYDLDITKNTFADVFKAMQQSRDFSQEALNNLWRSHINPPIEKDQQVSCQTVILVDDCYGLLEGHDVLVFNSDEADSSQHKLTIKQVLDNKNILDITQLDSHLSIQVELILSLPKADASINDEEVKVGDDQPQPINDTQRVRPSMANKAQSINTIDSIDLTREEDNEKLEPGSPTNFSISTLG